MSGSSLTNFERTLRRGKAAERGSEAVGDRDGRSRAANEPELCGDIDLRIARDGTWFYHGSPIGRKPLVKLFASILRRDEAGEYWLVTPAERCRIQVDDAPFTAVEMSVAEPGPNQALSFRTNIDEIVIAGADHPIRVVTDRATGEPSPYVLARDGLEALIVRAVFYDLVELAVEREVAGARVLGVWSGGIFFPIGEGGGG
jgi:hypothetical protein